MWRRIEIENFRSIDSARVALAPFTVLVGPNGSGKSNFADAFVFARDIGFDATTAVTRRGGITGVRRWSRSRPFDVGIEVRSAASQDLLDQKYQRHSFRIASGRQGKWYFKEEEIRLPAQGGVDGFIASRTAPTHATFSMGAAEGVTIPDSTSVMLIARQLAPQRLFNPLVSVRRYRLNPDLMRQPQVMTDDGRLDETGANVGSAIRRMKEGEGFPDLLLAMQRIVPGLKDIDVRELGRYLSLVFLQEQSGGTAEFTATEMSDGALRALGIVIAARQMTKDELLIIEEPEVNIHAGAANMLFDVLKEASRRGSVLVTTHSADLLDTAKDEEILVCTYLDGVSRIGPMDSEQRKLVRNGLFSTAELMRSEPLRIEGDAPRTIGPTAP